MNEGRERGAASSEGNDRPVAQTLRYRYFVGVGSKGSY